MKKTRESYCNRGRVFRMSAELVLNYLFPALAFGDGLGLKVAVEHHERTYWKRIANNEHDPD